MRRMRVGVIGGAALVMSAACAWGGEPPAEGAPASARSVERYVLAAGAMTVDRRDFDIADEAREKRLELRVRVPVPVGGGGQQPPEAGWPLLVFSHGAGGSRDAFGELLDFLATHGVASIAMTHEDSIALMRRRGDRAAGVATPAGRTELLRRVNLSGRVKDCVLVVDRLDEIAAGMGRADDAVPMFDKERIAVGGHSAGAFTTQLCVGVRARAAGIGARGMGMTSIGDARFKAGVIISGQGTTSRLLDDRSWSAVDVPIFVIAGSLDGSPPEMGRETPESRRHPFEKSRGVAQGGKPAYLLFIEGATHSAYAGKATSSLLGEHPTTNTEHIKEAVATGTLLFLRAHVMGDEESALTLQSEKLRGTIPGKAEFLAK
jgi:predicted dienelactone hydrolase